MQGVADHMKQTHKLKALADVQTVVNVAPSLDAAAKQLGINRSTLTRWMQQGKITRPASLPARPDVSVVVPPTAEGWKESVLAGHVLSATEQTLVDVADGALRLAKHPETPAFTRLAAMGRFAALVRQLNLEAKRVGEVGGKPVLTNPARSAMLRTSTDPRAILMAVK